MKKAKNSIKNLRKGDTVKVISGGSKRKGKIGKILVVDPKNNRIKVEGVAEITLHVKPQTKKEYPEGGIFKDIGFINRSNVMLMSESQNRPVRCGTKFGENGTKERVAKGKNVKAETL